MTVGMAQESITGGALSVAAGMSAIIIFMQICVQNCVGY